MRARTMVACGMVAVAVLAACSSDDDGGGAEAVTTSVAGSATTAAPTTAAPTTAAPTTAAPTTATPTTATPTTATPTTATPTTATPTTAAAPAGFRKIVPGGDCQCSDGSEFSFYVREADPTKVVLFFQGGGACFSAETCAGADATSKLTTGPADNPNDADGIFDLSDERNPLADHSFVYVPYCTGDVHLGDNTQEYSPEVTIQHKGFVNGTAALDHLVATFPDAEELLVTGESAGSIPSPLFAGLASDELPDAEITVLGDGSGAYEDVPAVNAGIGSLWGTTNATPDWPETEGLTPEEWSIPGLYIYSGAHDPDIVFARHDYAYDGVQAAFGAATGSTDPDLLISIDGNEEQIEATGVDLLSYVAPGSGHTTLSQDNFYRERVQGVRFVDWVTSLVNGEPVEDVHCERCRR